jgi:hypothetical protein
MGSRRSPSTAIQVTTMQITLLFAAYQQQPVDAHGIAVTMAVIYTLRSSASVAALRIASRIADYPRA